MVEDPAGHRTLLAPSSEVAELVSTTYSFDEVHVLPVWAEVAPSSWRVEVGALSLELFVGRRTALGGLLCAVPRQVAGAPWWATAADPVARVVLRGVRTRGTARAGAREWYGATDQHEVLAAAVRWDGEDCGPLARIEPPVRFGFGSVPPRPSVVDVVSTVER